MTDLWLMRRVRKALWFADQIMSNDRRTAGCKEWMDNRELFKILDEKINTLENTKQEYAAIEDSRVVGCGLED